MSTSLSHQRSPLGRAGPALAAVVLHGAVLAALVLLHGLARSKSEGLGADQSVAVTLVSAASLGASASDAANASTQLEQLQRRLTSDAALADAPKPAPRTASPTRLSDLLGEANPASPPTPSKTGAASGASANTQSGGGRGGMADPFALAAVSPQVAREMVQQGPAARIQAQANACWRGAPTSSAVRLAVDVDASGRLTRAPVIKRDLFAKLDDNRRAAEAEATRAVIACAPYRLAAATNARTYDLTFR